MVPGIQAREETAVPADSRDEIVRGQLASFVISSDVISVEEMSEAIGSQADISLAKGAVREGARARIPARQSSWEIREEAESVDEAISRLFHRLRPISEGLQRVRASGCSAKFSVVQRVMPNSDLGFVIDKEDVRFLADIGAFLDVDRYLGELD
jgi:hypothetical protein